ncbi:MAG: hypothetical protein ABI655_07140, partial [Phenylobacterium sp.]
MRAWDWLWPMLERPDDADRAREAQSLRADLEAVKAAKLDEDVEVLLDEARRLFDAEGERRKGADGRATAYLTVLGVLIPLLAAVAPSALGPTKDVAKSVVTLVLFTAAAGYLFGGAVWAFLTLRISVAYRMDAIDLVNIWATPARKADLVKGVLSCVRYERRGVNETVSAIKMAHAFGL